MGITEKLICLGKRGYTLLWPNIQSMADSDTYNMPVLSIALQSFSAYQVHSILEARVVFLQIGKFGRQVSREAETGAVTRHHGRVVVSEELLRAGVLVTVLLVLLTKPMGGQSTE